MSRFMDYIMVLAILISLVCCYESCGMLKDTSRDTNRQESKTHQNLNFKIKAEDSIMENMQTFTFYNDSSGYRYGVFLKPKGVFSFSPAQGFVGEAEWLQMEGSMEDVEKSGSFVNKTTAESSELNLQEENESTTSNSGKETMKTTALSWKMTMAIILVACLILLGLFYRIRSLQ